MYKHFFALLLIGSSLSVSAQQNSGKIRNGIPDGLQHRLDSTLQSFIDSNKTAGLSALITQNGKEIYYNAFGYADREAKIPMDRNTIVRIFSMTKPVTGVALMTLYEKGAFKLDDPISKYAPEFSDMKVFKGVDANGNLILEPAKRLITIRDITRHTAGFATPENPALAELIKKADAFNPNHSLAEMAAKLATIPLQFHPGDQWLYGSSVDVQAYLVEKISGIPFDEFLQKNIFDVLRMKNTHYTVPEQDRQRFAALYFLGNDGLSRVPDEQASAFNTKNWALKPGGWGLTSTLDDYTIFARMLLNRGSFGNKIQILKPETVKLMTTNQLPDTMTKRSWLPDKGNVGFGIDFAVRVGPPASREERNGAVGEFFWDGAASTLFWVDPANKITAVLFTQLFPYDPVKLHKKFRDAVYGVYNPSPAK